MENSSTLLRGRYRWSNSGVLRVGNGRKPLVMQNPGLLAARKKRSLVAAQLRSMDAALDERLDHLMFNWHEC